MLSAPTRTPSPPPYLPPTPHPRPTATTPRLRPTPPRLPTATTPHRPAPTARTRPALPRPTRREARSDLCWPIRGASTRKQCGGAKASLSGFLVSSSASEEDGMCEDAQVRWRSSALGVMDWGCTRLLRCDRPRQGAALRPLTTSRLNLWRSTACAPEGGVPDAACDEGWRRAGVFPWLREGRRVSAAHLDGTCTPLSYSAGPACMRSCMLPLTSSDAGAWPFSLGYSCRSVLASGMRCGVVR